MKKHFDRTRSRSAWLSLRAAHGFMNRRGPKENPVRARSGGFTLLELMIVIFMIMILLAIAIPQYQRSVQRSREAVLRQNLYDMRKLISEYTLDKQKAPQSLDDLVQAHYLNSIPKDPMTNQADWVAKPCEEDTISTPDEQDQGGICDVNSASSQTSTIGDAYNTW